MELDAKIEALLLARGESMEITGLAKYLQVKTETVHHALQSLERKLEGRGIELQKKGTAVALATSAEAAPLIGAARKEELYRRLGKARENTLSIIRYKSHVSRGVIEYIRGVNSTPILRNLLMRGLVSRFLNPKDQRSYLYAPTFELLSFLGITRVEELPDFDKVKRELLAFEKEQNTENGTEKTDDTE